MECFCVHPVFMDKNSKFYMLFFLQIRFRVFLWDIPLFTKYNILSFLRRNERNIQSNGTKLLYEPLCWTVGKKVKQSRYRPGQAQRGSGS